MADRKHQQQQERDQDKDELEADTLIDGSDICQQLMERYAKSSAPQHRHLLATAVAMRSILEGESLPLTPSGYFAASISAVDNASASESLDPTALSALSSFLSITLPLVQPGSISASNASNALGLLAGLLEGKSLSASSVRAVVKCVGILLEFCDLENWESVKLGFEILLKFAIDRRPKVRRCAQDCLGKILNSLKRSAIIKEASMLVFSMLRSCMPLAVKLSSSAYVDGHEEEDTQSTSQHLDVLHILNVVILAIPFLSKKVPLKMLKEITKLVRPEFSIITRHAFRAIETIIKLSKAEDIASEVETIIVSAGSYISLGDKNPLDTVVSAITLLKLAMGAGDRSIRIKNLPIVCGYMAGLLTSDANKAIPASSALKELIQDYVDLECLTGKDRFEDCNLESVEVKAIKLTCIIFEDVLNSYDGVLNEHILAVISTLFLKLGSASFVFMKNILLKLADLMNFQGNISTVDHLQDCIGSAVIALGPEKILSVIPISINAGDLTVQNMWLVPILQNHIVGASLRYYVEHIVPLAQSFQRESHEVKKSAIRKNLKTSACNLWRLLPAFCRHPIDMHRSFGMLAEVLIMLLRDDAFMHEDIAAALQVLVNQNKDVLYPKIDAGESNSYVVKSSVQEFCNASSYSKKTATKNIKALASSSAKLLQALSDVFVDTVPMKFSCVKDAIKCLASITDSRTTKNIFVSLLERFQFLNSKGEFEEMGGNAGELTQNAEGNLKTRENNIHRCVMLELASAFIVGAEEDLIHLIYSFIKISFQASCEFGHHGEYQTLSRILKEHPWFCASRFSELVDMLLDMQSPVDVESQRSRFSCFHALMVYSLKVSSAEESNKAFLILNEIILALKNVEEGHRKTAYDILRSISCSLRESSTNFDAHHKFLSMILGYLSGASPHIKSGAISALSVLVYEDADVCLSMPDLLPSLLSLLQGKAVEIIKAVLGFVKVLVSSSQAQHLHNIIFDVLEATLPWSSVSRHHFRSKVTVILEILIRKCGYAAIEGATPEKYKGFVKTVGKNRHGKTSSKDAEASVTDALVAGSSTNGKRDKQQKYLDSVSKKNESGHFRKRKREHNSGTIRWRTDDIATGDGAFKMQKRAKTGSRATVFRTTGLNGGVESLTKPNRNRMIEHKNKRPRERSGVHRPAKALKSRRKNHGK